MNMETCTTVAGYVRTSRRDAELINEE